RVPPSRAGLGRFVALAGTARGAKAGLGAPGPPASTPAPTSVAVLRKRRLDISASACHEPRDTNTVGRAGARDCQRSFTVETQKLYSRAYYPGHDGNLTNFPIPNSQFSSEGAPFPTSRHTSHFALPRMRIGN